jgi:hypothetical protein
MAPKKKAAPKKEADSAPKEKKIGLFDLIGDVSYEKRDLIRNSEDREATLKLYSPYMANRAFSFHPSSIGDANLMNLFSFLDPQMQHDFYLYGLRSEKRFSKWFKPEENETLDILAAHYNVNLVRAQEIMKVLTTEQLTTIVTRHENKGGVSKR